MVIRDGIYLIIAQLLIILILIFALFNTWVLYVLIVIGFILLGYLITIFYIPRINAPPFPKTILSPAYGKVIAIKENVSFEGNEFNEVTLKLSPFRSHINIIPMSGFVDNITSSYNINKGNSVEVTTKISTEYGTYYIKQIAYGFIHKITNNLHTNTSIDIDETFGYIIFNGLIKLFIPLNFEVLVLVKDKVEAGVDVIARLK
jgi:phosphatidylserine decarboxylase